MKHKTAQKVKGSGDAVLEKRYQELFGKLEHPLIIIPVNQSLEQPNPHRTIQTYVTYGAYEDPV